MNVKNRAYNEIEAKCIEIVSQFSTVKELIQLNSDEKMKLKLKKLIPFLKANLLKDDEKEKLEKLD